MSASPAAAASPAWIATLVAEAESAREAGRHALALAIYSRVAAAAPGHAAAALRLGELLNAAGRRVEAEAALRRAAALDPRAPAARHGLAQALLAQGRWREAGAPYQARFELPGSGHQRPLGLPFPEWTGGPVAGKRLIVFPEGGFGDQIQSARFAAQLRDQGAEVWLLCAAELARLFAGSLTGVRIVSAKGEVEFPQADYWATSGSLMFAAGAAPDALPAAPYLRTAALTLPAGFKVGLMAAGDPAWPEDPSRSLPPAAAERLRAELPGPVIDLAPGETGARDFADTAALIAALDLVVTVDTAAAHLAGALGKRTFVLLPHRNLDWRWMHAREDSPWYPSVTLYRADPLGGWDPALSRLARDAQALAEN